MSSSRAERRAAMPGSAADALSSAGAADAGTDRAAPIADRPEDLLRLVVALLADDLGRQRRRALDRAEWGRWSGETTVDEDGIGADSLARLELVARVSRMFRLHLTGVEDYLLLQRRLIDWAEIALEGLRRAPADAPLALAFQTSGSTGQPKIVTHALDDLVAEIAGHDVLFHGTRRIVALVPAHHIYGFLFTHLAPRCRGLDLLDLAGRAPAAVLAALAPGDMVVATPFLWGLLAEAAVDPPAGVAGVTSTAPMPPVLWRRLADRGFTLTEICGSTETAGLGNRTDPDAPFAPLAHLALDPGPPPHLRRRRDGQRLVPPDRLACAGAGGFRLCGRADGAVQVGGVNVFCDHVARRIADLPEVAGCAVRLDGAAPTARLKALVVPADGVPQAPAEREALIARLRAAMAGCLDAPERPGPIALASALPRDAMGKPVDWS